MYTVAEKAIQQRLKGSFLRMPPSRLLVPYTLFFNTGTSALRMWRAVQIMRGVEAQLKMLQANTESKMKLIATHGNRFILHMAFRSGLDPNNPDLDSTLEAVPLVVIEVWSDLCAATMKLYEASYPSNLFKNLTKCRELAKEISQKAAAPTK